jgi:hypothetical protein
MAMAKLDDTILPRCLSLKHKMRWIMQKTTLGLLSLLLATTGFAAQRTLPTVFADHMVLQREQPVPVWGTADAPNWNTNDVATVGTSAASGAFKTVTNRTEAVTDAKFIDMEVQIEQ